jgi:hypothetical protein
MHLALAFGAEGLLFYSYQPEKGPMDIALVDKDTLEPADGKYPAAAEVAALVETHGALIKSLDDQGAGMRIACSSIFVETVPLKGETDRYVYAVNKNTARAVSCRVFWGLGLPRRLTGWSRAENVFTAKSVAVAEGGWDELKLTQDHRPPPTGVSTTRIYQCLELDLPPGEGALLRLVPSGEEEG